MRDSQLVADGHRSTELRVQAVDRNGTPTAVPGLSWDTPEGRVRHVRMPRDGEYIAEYVPDRIREPQRHVLAVMASQALRADASLDVTPPPIRVVVAARVGLFYNFGHAAGPAAFVEAMRPLRAAAPAAAAGRNGRATCSTEMSGSGPEPGTSARLEIDEVPAAGPGANAPAVRDALRAVRRARRGDDARAHPALNTLTGEVGFDANGSAYAPAIGGGADVALTLKPGRLVFGLRYLWSQPGADVAGGRDQGQQRRPDRRHRL